MGVITEQRPCVTGGAALKEDFAKTIEKEVAIFIVSEDHRPVDPSDHQMV
jgi:hypothetical protein